ncbi:MAG: riboflavin kinase [Natronomonas sp.]|jgi:riboflavin kinase
MSETATLAVGADEVMALKRLALDGGLTGEVKLSCSAFADEIGTSTQTASRRLQRLDSAGLIARETVSDGQWIELTEDGEHVLRREYEDYRTVFEGPRTIELSGTITRGMGEGQHYISLSGYMEQFREKLGYEPFPGTLNVSMGDESVRRRAALRGFDAIHIEGWRDEDRTYGPASCYPAVIEGTDGDRYDGSHVIVPDRTHYDEDRLELIAPDRLRDALDLEDGDRVTVYVTE